MANNYGAFSEKAYPKNNNTGAYQESKKVVFSKSPKTRNKSSDTRNMNPVYKPSAGPGPNTLNMYGAPKTVKRTEGAFMEKAYPKAKPKSNFDYAAPKADKAKPKAKAKSKNVAGFKPGSIGAKAIGSFKKAYLGK